MIFSDEKDYIMRMIKEMVRVLASLMFGKSYDCAEQDRENRFLVAGKPLKTLLEMIDAGKINEAENILLDGIDYAQPEEVFAAALFYEHLSEKDDAFLQANNYSREEVLDGFRELLKKSGYETLFSYEL